MLLKNFAGGAGARREPFILREMPKGAGGVDGGWSWGVGPMMDRPDTLAFQAPPL